MSTGGVFKLIANDGKPDRMLVATSLLNQRIRDVSCARRDRGMDPMPTLTDLEKTHILLINAHFKPFAAMAFEYGKVRSSSGTVGLGGSVQFSIPQFGDFFHDMVLRVVMSETYDNTHTGQIANGTITNNYGLRSVLPAANTNWDGNAVAANTAATYTLHDVFGNAYTPTATSSYRNMVRYVEYPGERLAANVKFEVNGNPLDEYDSRIACTLRKFTISDEKLEGYKRLCGQEVEIEGYGAPRIARVEDTHYNTAAGGVAGNAAKHGAVGFPYAGSSQNVGHAPAAYMLAPEYRGAGFAPNQWQLDAPAAVATAPIRVGEGGRGAVDFIAGVNGVSTATYGHVQRPKMVACDGPQTPKYWQPPLELWIRLLFWFNLDAHISVPSASIPFGQRFITVELAQAQDIVTDFPGLFVRQTISSGAGAAVGDARNYTVNHRPYWATSNIRAPTISAMELYINNIFVNPEIHDLFIRRLGFSLIRVYRQHTTTKNSSGEQQELLSQLKWPIECMFVGFQPQHNSSSRANVNYHRDWHRMGKTFDSVLELRQQAFVGTDTAIAGAGIGTPLISSIGQIYPDTFVVERPVVETVSLTAHGVRIHDTTPQAFFSSYEPFHYGGACLRPPKDAGAMVINFGLYFGQYQPNGYLNISRARELYLHFTSAFIGPDTGVLVNVIGIAINFLLVTDGSAVLRYTT